MVIVVMGVAGSGKTTIGAMLAEALGCRFLDGDSLHSDASLRKMARGIPLTDADRAPWLAAIHAQLAAAAERGEDLVTACSSLKRSYREVLSEGVAVTWVYLTGPTHLLRTRLQGRQGHLVTADLLPSQLDALEEPPDAIVADISQPPEAIVRDILAEVRTRQEG